MERSERNERRIGGIDLWMTVSALAIALLIILTASQVEAQTFTILHSFTGGSDGRIPGAGLTLDAAGNLYGTTAYGGYSNNNCFGTCGTVFRLKRAGQGWVLSTLYQFRGGDDGANPAQKVVFGPDGSLYGMTWIGGGDSCPNGDSFGCGVVYRLRPPARFCAGVSCPWTEDILYRFAGGVYDGANPSAEPVFDAAGNIYGTTYEGGLTNTNRCVLGGGHSCGTVFKMTPSNGGWTESVIYQFTGESDGSNPNATITFDATGNLYSTATANGTPNGLGTVFKLTPSGYGWSENTLYTFSFAVGDFPRYGVIFDAAGNLYGSTPYGGTGDGGAVFLLQPSLQGWTFSPVFDFSGGSQLVGPYGDLVMDDAGNLYGTAFSIGDHHLGLVFELSPTMYGWTLNVLHQFAGGPEDGAIPYGGVVRDTQGNLYGTTQSGGTYNQGVVWEITP